MIATLSYVVALLYGAELLRRGQITLGALLAFMLYVGQFTWPMFALSEIVNTQSRGKAGLDRIEQVLRAPAPDWTSGETTRCVRVFRDAGLRFHVSVERAQESRGHHAHHRARHDRGDCRAHGLGQVDAHRSVFAFLSE